ncbi:MAG: prepilin-type N-terminal cleavage/methylation domain-containing protein [Phycisphaerae bacterium]
MSYIPTNQPRKPGFTLIELMVVIAIIIILMLVAVPALNSIFANASLTMAENQIRSTIALARAQALRDRRSVGVVFFEPDATLDQNQFKDRSTQSECTGVQLIVYDHSLLGVDYYTPLVASRGQGNSSLVYRAVDYLPVGLRVGTLSDVNGAPLRTEFSSPATKARVILFDSNGQLTLADRLATGTDGRTEWYLNATPADATLGISSPGFVIYDSNKLRNSVDMSQPAVVNDWIFRNANLYVVNPYTGGIIR